LNEKLLIQQTLNGDTKSFEHLVLLYQGKLMRFLRARCYIQHQAEDVYQETFISAYRYLSSYNDKYEFSTWLFNIAINILKKHYTHQQGMQSVEDNQQLVESLVDEKQNELSNQQYNIWLIAKQILPEEHYDVLWFSYVEGYTSKQVAQVVDKSVAWVKINSMRSKQQLKKQLLSMGYQFTDLAEVGYE